LLTADGSFRQTGFRLLDGIALLTILKSMSAAGRPPAFTYKQGQLAAEGVDCARLAHRYDTPLYVYSQRAIEQRMRAFQRAFRSTRHTICYSVKANSNLSLLRVLWKLGGGFDVVSGGELERVLHVSRRTVTKVVFSGVGKTASELDAALRAGILMFNVESEGELELLAERASKLRKPARVALRVNPNIAAVTHPYISTGVRDHKFGVDAADARRLYGRAAADRYLLVTGISVHIGSQIIDPLPFAETAARIGELVRALRQDGHAIQYVDVGGGLGVDYQDFRPEEFDRRLAAYATSLRKSLTLPDTHLLLEPGRAIVANAGLLLTRVLYVKNGVHKRFVIVDAAMNDLIRPALYSAYHEIYPVRDIDHRTSHSYDVVGPICETGDFFARDRVLAEPAPGELLAIFDTGAYGMTLASNYNTRCRPAEVLVNGRKAKLIRRRETIKDLLAQEIR
jgi:diaminopimelate decarboxylase